MIKEQLQQHVIATVREYLRDCGYEIDSPDVDAVVGAALLSGMCLMAGWFDDLSDAGCSSDEIIEAIVELGEECGYRIDVDDEPNHEQP